MDSKGVEISRTYGKEDAKNIIIDLVLKRIEQGENLSYNEDAKPVWGECA